MQSDISVVGEVGNTILDLIFRIRTHLRLGIYPDSVSRSPPTSTQSRYLESHRISVMG